VSHPLDGCREKITRAGDHLERLDRESRRFVEENRYILTIEDDMEHPPERVVRLRSVRQPEIDPPLRFGILAGEILYNLRSALDYLIWELATVGGGPGERNQFPIFDTPKQFEHFRERYLYGVRNELWTAIEAYQPYKGRLEGHYLRALAVLNDVDKHRVVHARTQSGMTGEGTLKLTNVTSARISSADWTHFEDGAQIYRILSWEPPDAAQVEVQADVRYTILFGDPATIAMSRLDLVVVRDIVSNIIESFAAEFISQPGP
jgi:hypothetical protein